MLRSEISRRSLFRALAVVPVAISLTSCGGRTEAQLQTDVQTIATGLANVLTDLQAVPGVNISANTAAQIAAEIALMKTDAAEIAQAAAPGQTAATQFVEVVQTLANLVEPFANQAPAVGLLITAATSLTQVILADAGVLSMAQAEAAPMSAPAARAVLLSRARAK